MEPLAIIAGILSVVVFFSGGLIMYYKFDKRGKEIDAEKEREQRAH